MIRLIASAAILAASPSFVAAEDMTVAIVQSLTGPAAFVGVGARDGMLLAIDEINASGQLGDLTLVPVVEDDATDRGQSISLTQRFARNPQVLAMLGPTTGTIAGAVAQVANDAELPMYTVTNLVEALSPGPWSFIHAQPAEAAVPNAVNFVVDQLDVESCAFAELVDNPAFVRQRTMFEEMIAEHGIKTLSTAGIKLSDTDFSSLAVRIVREDPDCVFMTLPPVHAANFIIQLRQNGLDSDTRLIGATGMAGPDLISIGGAAVEGVYVQSDWIPGGSSEAGEAFNAAFVGRYGTQPDLWAANGYSMAYILADAIVRAGSSPDRAAVRDALTTTKDVPVVIGTGLFSFDENRIPHYGNAFMQVNNGAFTVSQ